LQACIGSERRSERERGDFSGGRSPGVSRGTTGLELHSFISKRIKYIEPYAGFRTSSSFPPARAISAPPISGSLVNHPRSKVGSTGDAGHALGAGESFQRVTFDGVSARLPIRGARLLRALRCARSSSASSLRRPNFRSYMADPPTSRSPTKARRGSTRLASPSLRAHGMMASVSVTWQAASTSSSRRAVVHACAEPRHHADQPCNPISAVTWARAGRSGREESNGGHRHGYGHSEPHYRPTIDAVGHRFRADDTNLFDAWIMAS